MRFEFIKKYARLPWPALILILVCWLPLAQSVEAHVGSSGVIVQKQAGKYQLLVSIKPPDVVPGTASITVFVEQGRVSTIGARPIYFNAGDEGAPTHDILKSIDTHRYEGEVWLMESGSSSIELSIDGPDGKQQVVVPVMAEATALREMPAGTGFALAALGLLLVVMLITIIGASNADGVTPPNQPIPASIQRRRYVGMGIGLVVLTLLLTGWRFWWTSKAADYRNEQLFRPMPIHTSIQVIDAQRQLTIRFDTARVKASRWNRRKLSYLIPDHGKLMHAFLVRVPGLDAFAHLHPARKHTLQFQTALPPLPGGKYLLYADIVYRSGFTETVTDTVDVPALRIRPEAATSARLTDSDDSWLTTEPMGVKTGAAAIPRLDNDMVICGKPGAGTRLADGSTMLWMDKPSPVLETGKVYTLKFAVADSAGKAAMLEPYLGMGGHAVLLRSDGTVYIHLHPIGTYSMAAEGSFVSRIADTARTFLYPRAASFRDSIDAYVARLNALSEAEKNKQLMGGMPVMKHSLPINNMVEFPYAFPRAGHYRIWVQVKRNGRVLTGVFDTQVDDPLM
ncbi:hypothetical protein [Spirosoma koreense]